MAKDKKIGDGNNNNHSNNKDKNTTKTMTKVSSGVSDFSSFDVASTQYNNQPVALLASFNASLIQQKESTCGVGGMAWPFQRHCIIRCHVLKKPGALVVSLHITSGIGDVASSNAASPLSPPQEKQSTCGVSNLFQHHAQKKQSICGIPRVCSSVSHVSSSFNAMFRKTINLQRYSTQHPKKGNQLTALVVWLGFSRRIGDVASSNAATPQKNNQPAPLTLHPIKNQFVALVGLVPCCIDATSLPPKINLRHCWPSLMPRPKKNPAALVVGLCATSGIGNVASSDAVSPPKNNQPAAFLVSFDAIQKKQPPAV